MRFHIFKTEKDALAAIAVVDKRRKFGKGKSTVTFAQATELPDGRWGIAANNQTIREFGKKGIEEIEIKCEDEDVKAG